jgi:hypothetical protein
VKRIASFFTPLPPGYEDDWREKAPEDWLNQQTLSKALKTFAIRGLSVLAIWQPQTIVLPAVGDGLIARRVAFLFLDGADQVGFPEFIIIF